MSNNNLAVSVIIPSYNSGKYLSKSIQSALCQTVKPSQVFVVDDGSTDSTYDVVRNFDRSVVYIWQENQGLPGARNTGILAAQGELIGLLDADDIWEPDYLKKMLSLVERNPEAAVYYSSAQAMDVHGSFLPQVYGDLPVASKKLFPALLRANFLVPSTILMRRSVALEVGLFDPALKYGCEDWDLWLRISPRYDFAGTAESLVRYRVHPNSMSFDLEKMRKAVCMVIEKNFGVDDGQWNNWSNEKRQAYGGIHRREVINSIKYRNDWTSPWEQLRLALLVDPTTSVDLDFFYDLALGAQPPGYRNTPVALEVEKNAACIHSLLDLVFEQDNGNLHPHRLQTYGTAYYALGLVAYSFGFTGKSRVYFSKALFYRQNLIKDKRLVGKLAKSLISRRIIEQVKKQFAHS
jgi:glycosyltransferase involved in cell wall biosynthesis